MQKNVFYYWLHLLFFIGFIILIRFFYVYIFGWEDLFIHIINFYFCSSLFTFLPLLLYYQFVWVFWYCSRFVIAAFSIQSFHCVNVDHTNILRNFNFRQLAQLLKKIRLSDKFDNFLMLSTGKQLICIWYSFQLLHEWRNDTYIF